MTNFEAQGALGIFRGKLCHPELCALSPASCEASQNSAPQHRITRSNATHCQRWSLHSFQPPIMRIVPAAPCHWRAAIPTEHRSSAPCCVVTVNKTSAVHDSSVPAECEWSRQHGTYCSSRAVTSLTLESYCPLPCCHLTAGLPRIAGAPALNGWQTSDGRKDVSGW